MHRLRSTWAALIGGAFLVTLSVSAAFGAPPTGEDAPRGQTVAGFVHELVFGPAEQPEDEELVVEEQEEDLGDEGDEGELAEELVVEDDLVVDGEVASAHGECVSEEASDKTDEDVETDGNHGAVVSFAAQETCRDTEDVIEADPEEDPEREVPEEFANHGECVSEAAQDHESEGATEAMTHGKWVSDHARYICWGLEVPTDDVTEESTLEDEADEADAAELTAQEERKAELAAARAERKAAQEAAVAERKAAQEAAVAQRKADHAASQGARPANAGNSANAGGNGRGGGRP